MGMEIRTETAEVHLISGNLAFNRLLSPYFRCLTEFLQEIDQGKPPILTALTAEEMPLVYNIIS